MDIIFKMIRRVYCVLIQVKQPFICVIGNRPFLQDIENGVAISLYKVIYEDYGVVSLLIQLVSHWISSCYMTKNCKERFIRHRLMFVYLSIFGFKTSDVLRFPKSILVYHSIKHFKCFSLYLFSEFININTFLTFPAIFFLVDPRSNVWIIFLSALFRLT